MNLDSYLEVFTTLFGWMFYRVLWDVLLQTGIAYLPFLGILVEHWKKPLSETRMESASEWSVRSLEVELFSALFFVVLAAQPSQLTTLAANSLQYTPVPTLNEPDPMPVDLSNNDSTYGKTGFSQLEHSVATPAWWYGVLALSSGVNHAVIEGLPKSQELRQAIQLARMVTIEDPVLRQTLAQFYNDCYIPSRSKYHREQPSSGQIDSILERRGMQELDWIGSQIYRKTPGYYDYYRASKSVQGWPYSPDRDTEYDPANPPEFGRPHCKEWWEHPVRGLLPDLIQTVNVQASGYISLLITFGLQINTEDHKDVVAKTALLNRPATWSNNELAQRNTATSGWLSHVESSLKSILSGLGITIAAAGVSITIAVLLQFLPILQALILFGIYTMLPLLMVFSRYSLGVMISVGVAVFAIKFWTVLWYVAQWLDQNLITSMYPETNLLIENFLLETEHSAKRILLNTATTTMYIGFPILWSIVMGWAGVRAARSIDGLASPYNRVSSDAGSRGVSIASSAMRR